MLNVSLTQLLILYNNEQVFSTNSWIVCFFIYVTTCIYGNLKKITIKAIMFLLFFL